MSTKSRPHAAKQSKMHLAPRLASFFLPAVALLGAALSTGDAYCATPYNIQLKHGEFHNDVWNSCEFAHLKHNGDPLFSVNGTPLPTYEVPGSYFQYPNGDEQLLANAAFQSVLLRSGTNDFSFSVGIETGDDSCVHSTEYATLQSPALAAPKVLFDVARHGTAYSGNTNLAMTLGEVNPPLARSIAALEQAISHERETLISHAAQTADLNARLDALAALETELTDLANRPLDQISMIDVDAIINRYRSVVSPETRNALDQLLTDLSRSVEDLRRELNRLVSEFGTFADQSVDFATAAARATGFNPDDSANYLPLGSVDIPAIDVPSVSDVAGGFNPANDPYSTYATKVIERLDRDVINAKVVERADFVATVQGWRANQKALANALRSRTGVSQAETSAFLAAQNRVTAYVRRFMDASDWFIDSPVSLQLRSMIDDVLMPQMADGASRLKVILNRWDHGYDEVDQTLVAAIQRFVGVIDDEVITPMQLVAELTIAAERVGLGFVPVVGPALDLCEAISGHAMCMPGGEELSDEARVFSAVGGGMAMAASWKAVSFAMGGVVPRRVAGKTAVLIETQVGKGLRLYRTTRWRNLHAAVSEIGALNEFEKTVARSIQTRGNTFFGLGEDAIASALKVSRNANKLPDFISITSGGKLLITEAKGLEKLTGVGVDVTHCLEKFEVTSQTLQGLGYGSEISTFEIAVPRGAPLANGKLGTDNLPMIYSISGDQLLVLENGRTHVVRDRLTGLVIHVLQLDP